MPKVLNGLRWGLQKLEARALVGIGARFLLSNRSSTSCGRSLPRRSGAVKRALAPELKRDPPEDLATEIDFARDMTSQC